FLIYDDQPTRARWARSRLRARGFESVTVAANALSESWITGPARVHLWRPHALLIEALELIAGATGGENSQTAAHNSQLRSRRAADLACGTGCDLVYLAMQGWHATGYDILPDALERAAGLARRHGVDVVTHTLDLESDRAVPLDSLDL